VVTADNRDIRPFSIDKQNSEFFVANYLWNQVSVGLPTADAAAAAATTTTATAAAVDTATATATTETK